MITANMIKDDEKFVQFGLNHAINFLAGKTEFSQQTKSIVKELLEYVYFGGDPKADLKNATYVVERFIEVNVET
jgi:hypothetical protein